MNCNDLMHLIQTYSPTDSWEQQCRTRMLDFIEKNPDCCECSLFIGHMTASAWLLSADHKKVLLMHHAKLNQWVQLGGHCDGDPDVLGVAIKEAQEESGIQNIRPTSLSVFDIDIHPIPETRHGPAHDHYDVRFLLEVAGNESVIPNRESHELRWISKNRQELPTSSPSVVRMFDKWIQRGE